MQIAAQCRAYLAEYARIALRHAPIPSVHRTNEPLQVGSSSRRRSLHARRAQNRRSAAPLPQMQALLATAATKWVPGIVPKGWSRCCWPPSSCSHHLPATLRNAGIEGRGESVKVSSGHKEACGSKRCSAEVKARCVEADEHAARDISSTLPGRRACDLCIGPFDAGCTFFSRSAQCRAFAFEARQPHTARTCRAAKTGMMRCLVGPAEVHPTKCAVGHRDTWRKVPAAPVNRGRSSDRIRTSRMPR